MSTLLLASRSPRRRALLEQAGIAFTLLDLDVDESLPEPPAPREHACRLAERKAVAGARLVTEGWVLGADTLVAVQGRVLGKPDDRDHAREMLQTLSGTTHEVVTGVCLHDAASGRSIIDAGITRVTMRPMSSAEIANYVASGESDDKAGAYAIQERGDEFVESIEGSWSNVVGLPMELLRNMMGEAGLLP